jgi:hypothetical protein
VVIRYLHFANGIFIWLVIAQLLHASAANAETALEAVVRESKNTRVDPLRAKSAQIKAAANTADKTQAAVPPAAPPADAQMPQPLVQRVEEIVVEGQREPEDVVPAKKTPFQNMQDLLDGVGKSAAPSVVESQNNGGTRSAVFKVNGGCYVIKNNAGQMNNDGSLGSAGRDAMTCTKAEASRK